MIIGSKTLCIFMDAEHSKPYLYTLRDSLKLRSPKISPHSETITTTHMLVPVHPSASHILAGKSGREKHSNFCGFVPQAAAKRAVEP